MGLAQKPRAEAQSPRRSTRQSPTPAKQGVGQGGVANTGVTEAPGHGAVAEEFDEAVADTGEAGGVGQGGVAEAGVAEAPGHGGS